MTAHRLLPKGIALFGARKELDFCAIDEEEAASAPGTLHRTREANIKAAMNLFFISGSL